MQLPCTLPLQHSEREKRRLKEEALRQDLEAQIAYKMKVKAQEKAAQQTYMRHQEVSTVRGRVPWAYLRLCLWVAVGREWDCHHAVRQRSHVTRVMCILACSQADAQAYKEEELRKKQDKVRKAQEEQLLITQQIERATQRRAQVGQAVRQKDTRCAATGLAHVSALPC